MKKILSLLAVLVLVCALFAAWKTFGPTVRQPTGKYFYVHTGWTYGDLVKSLDSQHMVHGT
ncbi:MAG TPA: hypothetical protein VGC95_12755, partial [Chitinophagaceae bacterium]